MQEYTIALYVRFPCNDEETQVVEKTRDDEDEAWDVAQDLLSSVDDDPLIDEGSYCRVQVDRYSEPEKVKVLCCGNELTSEDSQCPNCWTDVQEIIDSGVECNHCESLLLRVGAWIIDREYYCPDCRTKIKESEA